MEQLQKWLQTTGGKAATVLLSLALIGLVVWMVMRAFGTDTPGDPNNVTYVCSETGKPFTHRNLVGESIPIMSPYSGKETGYPAEPCYWTADGQAKTAPTWVLLNETLGKHGPTFCPDCGRLVVAHNPPPGPGVKPPPIQQELMHSSAGLSDH